MTEQLAKTVIIVGAGASYEFGLPVGSVLQDRIRSQTNMDTTRGGLKPFYNNVAFYNSLPAAAGLLEPTSIGLDRLAKKSLQISQGVQLAASIDNYLHAHNGDPELVAVGKYAIAQCILDAEKSSSLAYSGNGNSFHGRGKGDTPLHPHQSWIGLLTKSLSAGRDFSDFCQALSSITFVCFNYDRCIERYLSGAASQIYPSSVFSYEALDEATNIIHPYGFLGELRPEEGTEGTFGKNEDPSFAIEAALNIKTFTEGMDDNVTAEIGEVLSEAANAVFLGYGFITTNDDFLFGDGPFNISTVLGTTYGISDERTEFISDKLKHACMMRETPYDGLQQRGSPQLRSEGCADLLHRFSHLFELIGRS